MPRAAPGVGLPGGKVLKTQLREMFKDHRLPTA